MTADTGGPLSVHDAEIRAILREGNRTDYLLFCCDCGAEYWNDKGHECAPPIAGPGVSGKDGGAK